MEFVLYVSVMIRVGGVSVQKLSYDAAKVRESLLKSGTVEDFNADGKPAPSPGGD